MTIALFLIVTCIPVALSPILLYGFDVKEHHDGCHIWSRKCLDQRHLVREGRNLIIQKFQARYFNMQRFSYISTPKCQPNRYCSVVDITRSRATKHPNQEILIHRRPSGERLSLTNEVLETKSTLLANYLYSMGVKRNQCVSIIGPNTLEWVVGELAILKTGAASVHLTISTSDGHDAMDIIKKTDCRYILMDPGLDKSMTTSLHALKMRIKEWNEINPGKQRQAILLRMCEGFDSFPCLEDISKYTIDIELPVIYPEDTALVLGTSGSTGKPKLVKVSHISIVYTHSISRTAGDFRKVFNHRPFAWVGGFSMNSLVSGFPRLFTYSTFTSNEVWETIKEERCESAVLTPSVLSAILEFKVRNPDDSYILKTVFSGGVQITDICKRALGSIFSELYNAYGATEVGVVSMKYIGPNADFVRGDVGHCSPGVEVKIVDTNGYVTLWGTEGEIYVRSNYMSQGYLNAADGNEDLFAEGGWMKTGDIGKVREDGNLILTVGRARSVISRGARTLIPAMIEDVLRGISDLKEVVVISVPGQFYSEVCACYIAETESDINEKKIKVLSDDLFLKSDIVDGLGAPTYFVKFTEFPALFNGKIDKLKLKEIAMSILGLS